MKRNSLWAGLCTGIILGAILVQSKKKSILSSEVALRLAKKDLQKNGTITGSWIHMKPELFHKGNTPVKVYRGGITRTVENGVEQLEFCINASTGRLVDVKSL